MVRFIYKRYNLLVVKLKLTYYFNLLVIKFLIEMKTFIQIKSIKLLTYRDDQNKVLIILLRY